MSSYMSHVRTFNTTGVVEINQQQLSCQSAIQKHRFLEGLGKWLCVITDSYSTPMTRGSTISRLDYWSHLQLGWFPDSSSLGTMPFSGQRIVLPSPRDTVYVTEGRCKSCFEHSLHQNSLVCYRCNSLSKH